MKPVKRYLILSVAAAIGLLLFYGCGSPLAPFDAAVIQNAKDRTAPVLEIETPTTDSVFGQTVTVSGRVSDQGGAVDLITWTINGPLGTLDYGSIDSSHIGNEGEFSFSFGTSDYKSSIVINIEAVDWNGNTASTSVNLNYSGSAIPSFTAVPGNKQVELFWDEVDGASNYTVYYTKNGNIPSEVYTEAPIILTEPPSADNPLLIAGLENGQKHIFILIAEASDNRQWNSKYIYSIPVSEDTFTPVASCEGERIKVEWTSRSAADGFEVWRSESAEGPYTNVSGVITGNRFYDDMVSPGILYYYKVRPAEESGRLCGSDSAEIYPYTVSEITELYSCTAEGDSLDIEIFNDYAYIAAGNAGLQVIDINPGRSTFQDVVWTAETTGSAVGIDIYGEYAYIALGDSGIDIFQIAKGGFSGRPVLRSNFCPSATPPVYVYALQIHPAYPTLLLVANGGNGFQFYNVASPTSPGLTSFSYGAGSCFFIDVVANAGYAYVVDAFWGLPEIKRFDTVYPPEPTPHYDFSYSGFEADDFPHKLLLSDDYLFAGSLSYVYICNNSTNQIYSSLQVAGEVTDMATQRDRLYVLEGGQNIRLIDINDAASPRAIDLRFYNKDFSSLEMDGTKIVCGNSSGGITVLGGAEVSAAIATGYITDSAWGIDLSGDSLYIADKGIRHFHLDDGDFTADGDYYNTNNGTVMNKIFRDVCEQNGKVYATYLQDLIIWDSRAPSVFRSITLPDDARGVTVRGDYAYIGARFHGLQIVDISDIESLEIAAFCNTSGQADHPVICGNILCLDDGTEGVALIDITDPGDPVLKGYCSVSSTVNDVAVINGMIAAACDGGLEIFDISNPANPVKVGGLPSGQTAGNIVKAAGDNIFLYDSDTDLLRIIIASDPAKPYIVANVALESLDDMVVSGDRIYLIDNNKVKYIDISLE